MSGDGPASAPADASSKEQSLLEPYARFREEPLSALHELGLHFVGEGWRSYDRIVGQEIFYPGFSDNMKSMVMQQGTLRKQISLLAQKRMEVELLEGRLGPLGVDGEEEVNQVKRRARRKEIERELESVAEHWTNAMICKMDSRYFIRGAYYLATQLLTRAYHQGIHVNVDEVKQLHHIAENAAKKKQSIIFLPCHRSHVDYVSLQLICYRLGLALPTVVAGDNLNFPVVGPFLQHAGAMWIRRSFGDDQLYPTLVQAYMDTLLQNGYNVECFVEGGRSRVGKLLQPKFGILSFFLDSVMSGRVEDALICPVSTQYDKVIEVDSYVRELLGQPKPKEDLASFLSASNVLSLKLGRVDVRFHQPWSLREFINEQKDRLGRMPKTDPARDETLRRRILQTLGYKILSDINKASVVMPTALVGTVLLTLRGPGVGKSELVRRVDWLCKRINSAGGRVAHFAGSPTEVVVERALEVLGTKLVGRIGGLVEDTYYAEDRFQLSFYRNMTIHLFISQALVCAAVYTKAKKGGASDQRMSIGDLDDYVFFLSQLFRAEFIFPPTTSLDVNVRVALESLERDRILEVGHVRCDSSKDIDSVQLHLEERAHGHENFDFYNFLIWPFIEAAWLGAIALFMLKPPPSNAGGEVFVDYRVVQYKAQLLGKTLYHQGMLSYYEAVNKEALKNAFNRSEEAGIIIVNRSKDAKIPARVRLDLEWIPSGDVNGKTVPNGKLWELCERIDQSRRGEHDLHNDTVSRMRVLGLINRLGAALFDNAVLEADGQPSRSQRRRGIQTVSHL